MTDDLLHGGALDLMRRRFPDAKGPWLDLSTGVSPFAYPDVAVSDAALRNLPTRAMMHDCRSAMAAAIGAPDESLLLAPGSELLIRLLPDMITPRSVAILSPSYGDHARVWRAAGADVIETPSPLEHAENVDAIVLCNPNNPDGSVFARRDLESVRAQMAARGGWLIVDEAYADLNPVVSLAPLGGENGLIVFRSFGKFYGLAGVRLGALIAPGPIRNLMTDRLGVWPVSGAALEIGARVYADKKWAEDTRVRLAAARARVDRILAKGGVNICGGTDLFRFVEAQDAYALWERLARSGVYVRRFDWSPRHLRIGLPPDGQAEERLRKALTL